MKLLNFNDQEIEVLQATPNPAQIVSSGLQSCMKKDVDFSTGTTEDVLKYLLKAEHMSPLEHVGMTIYVKNISRALLCQITRQRTFKFTASSQHYQDYSNYPMVVPNNVLATINHNDTIGKEIESTLNTCLDTYISMLDEGFSTEHARYVLPEAVCVNLQITADARNMVYFFKQRRCLRNVDEMVQFADLWWGLANKWFPELFSNVGAPCYMDNKCNQGRMKADTCRRELSGQY
jgi:thymidylate synthase (FAD)